MKILVVDDYPELCQVIVTGLTKFGHSVEAVHDYSDAMDLINRQYDVLIVDIYLDEADHHSGLEVAKQYKARYNKSIKVVVLTAHSEAFQRLKVDQNTINEKILKPVDIKDLNNIITSENYLDQNDSNRMWDDIHLLKSEVLDLKEATRENSRRIENALDVIQKTNTLCFKLMGQMPSKKYMKWVVGISIPVIITILAGYLAIINSWLTNVITILQESVK